MLNKRIRALLAAKGMTQVALAEQIGIEPGYLSELLNQKEPKRWNIDHINDLSRALGVDPWQLFVDPSEAAYPGSAIAVAYMKAPDHKQKTVNDILGLNDENDSKKNNGSSQKRA